MQLTCTSTNLRNAFYSTSTNIEAGIITIHTGVIHLHLQLHSEGVEGVVRESEAVREQKLFVRQAAVVRKHLTALRN